MEGERELYRTRIADRAPNGEIGGSADCILTDRRVLVKWDNGVLSQYMLTDITHIWCEPLLKNRYMKKHFGDAGAGAGQININLVTQRSSLLWYSTSAYELIKQTQKAMMPF